MEHPVEIKLNVEPAAIDATLRTLGLKHSGSQKRSVYFLETRTASTPHGLDARGVVLRVRIGATADCTLKLRPCDPGRLPAERERSAEGDGWKFRIEQDWSAAQPLVSASLEYKVDAVGARAAIRAGDMSQVPSTDQLGLFHAYTSQPLDTQALEALGPVVAHKWELKAGDKLDGRKVGHKLDVEEWMIPDALHFLELSAREDVMDAARATRVDIAALCHRLDVPLSTSPRLKTKAVLDHFSAHLAGSR